MAAEAAALAGGVRVLSWTEDRDPASSWSQRARLRRRRLPRSTWTWPPRPNLLYTSGTTGFPKGVERPAQLPATVRDYLEAQVEPEDAGTFLAVGPLYHTGPMRAVRRLAGGRPLYVLPELRRRDACSRRCAREQVTGTLMVPTHFARLLALPAGTRAAYDVSHMRVAGAHRRRLPGAAEDGDDRLVRTRPRREVRRHRDRHADLHRLARVARAPGSVGRAVPPFEAVVVDDDDQEVGRGVEGRLYFRDTTGRGITFYGDADKTAAAHLAPNVFTVGDIGVVDDDGFVYITGRHSDMVVSGGVNLYPAESEQVLLRHPDVVDVAVIGVPHESMGEQLKALVVRSGPATADELIAYCRANLAHPKCPRSVDFVDDLGRNPMGKINKKSLRAPYWPADETALPGR